MNSSSVGGDGYSSSSSQAEQSALADMFTIKCDTGFIVVFFGESGSMVEGEAAATPCRVLCTLITVSVASAWFSRRESIRKLLLFFSHWLSGLLYSVTVMAQASMISVCWAAANLTNFIKTLNFLELASSNMLALTNLGICINLALIVMSHRTLSRINSLSSPTMIFIFLVLSMGAAAATIPFWDLIVVSATKFIMANYDQGTNAWIHASRFFVEFFVGVVMLLIVVWLLLFWMKEIKECWKIHSRIRYYFGLTLIGTGVNLAVGICGTMFVVLSMDDPGAASPLFIVVSWTLRYVHLALDTIVLYGVLGAPARHMNECAELPDDNTSAMHSRGGRSSSNPETCDGGFRNKSLSSGSSNKDRSGKRCNPGTKHTDGKVQHNPAIARAALPSGAPNRSMQRYSQNTTTHRPPQWG